MPIQGYPDYTRLTTSGGYQLASIAGTFASGALIFTGYVGSWPYLNIFTFGFTGPAYAAYKITYYTDATLTQMAGSQRFTRSAANAANTQYEVLGPWCTIQVTTDTAGPITITELNLYGSYGGAGAARLSAPYTTVAVVNDVVAANTTVVQVTARVLPGPAVINVLSAVSAWGISVRHYNFDVLALQLWWQVDSTVAPLGGTWEMPLPDAPIELHVSNNTAAAGMISATILAASY